MYCNGHVSNGAVCHGHGVECETHRLNGVFCNGHSSKGVVCQSHAIVCLGNGAEHDIDPFNGVLCHDHVSNGVVSHGHLSNSALINVWLMLMNSRHGLIPGYADGISLRSPSLNVPDCCRRPTPRLVHPERPVFLHDVQR